MRVKNKQNLSTRKFYVCGVDWQHELGSAGDVKLYTSVKELKSQRQCWKSCGIVEIKATPKWVHPQDLFKEEEFESLKKMQKSIKEVTSRKK